MDYVNRDNRGYVDFEKMIGLDGIAIVNIVSNPSDAPLSGGKELQTRISHNDGLCVVGNFRRCTDIFLAGGTWKPITPPGVDSQGRKYACDTTVREYDNSRPTRVSSFSRLEMCSSPSRIYRTFRSSSYV